MNLSNDLYKIITIHYIKTKMNFIKKNILVFTGIIAGALAGYLYWKYIGCLSATCAITSKPVNSTIYGSPMGGLLFSLFKPPRKKSEYRNYDISRTNTSGQTCIG